MWQTRKLLKIHYSLGNGSHKNNEPKWFGRREKSFFKEKTMACLEAIKLLITG